MSDVIALSPWDYAAFGAFLAGIAGIAWWAGRGERESSDDYFLAGKTLPWYVVGGSFIASNISSEHLIGMVGAAVVFGVCPAMMEWANVATFSLLIWFFIPFLLAARVFTIPEFLERRFGVSMRLIFAVVTVISNVTAFLAGVLYGGGIALHSLFGWDLWLAVVSVGLVAGLLAIYGGLSSVAWSDLLTVAVLLAGGAAVAVCGLQALAPEGTLVDGFATMIERNRATGGEWAEASAHIAAAVTGGTQYDRLSVFQPADHPIVPAVSLVGLIVSVSVWYNVLNQFMIQRVLGAKDQYHARMGIVFAGWIKVFMPAITVLPGLILFALRPEILTGAGGDVRQQADQGYVQLIQEIIPVGLRGLLLAALFGAIQSTVSAVLNSTSTVLTLDLYKRVFDPKASERRLVTVGVVSTTVVLAIAIVLGGFVGRLGGGLFEYAQTLYAFFAPPFAAVFLLGILWRRTNATGAIVAVLAGFAFGVAMKLYVMSGWNDWNWLVPYSNQAGINWLFCVLVCAAVSLVTPPPPPEQVTDQLTMNWRTLNIFGGLGRHWSSSVVTWWGLFVLMIAGLMIVFSGLVLGSS